MRDTVLFSHTDADRVRGLVEASPALANAAVDWGFGDWESALGAASHMGRRDIAEILLAQGARPDVFTNAMLGNLAAVKGTIEAIPGVQRTPGPHGITLLAHARAGGERAKDVVAYLESVGDADVTQSSVPLPAEQKTYVGTYSFGAKPAEEFQIVEQRGNLAFQHGEGFPRTLFHLGENQFHPTGARGVRIKFQIEGSQAVKVRVYDPDLLVEAHRVARPASP